jgi:hypothetical protein
MPWSVRRILLMGMYVIGGLTFALMTCRFPTANGCFTGIGLVLGLATMPASQTWGFSSG